ncbi:MAG: histidine--tRNA ligase [Flavobacteriales bacterium]|nr:MAG: histidine--tRNA ligase [Flavobacteriales bacterium]
MSNKPSIPKGTRDFSPTEMARRNYIFDTIKKVYKRYGFQQIETPAMENLDTLIGTGGDESDQLIFKILNSGNFLSNVRVQKSKFRYAAQDDCQLLDDALIGERYPLSLLVEPKEILNSISEKALRYDLTVPFARYVVQNQNDITFPFRRFQIQPVWRADRPQKGRYREFYQCDADIIGSDSLVNEVDLIKIIDDVFTELFQGKLDYTISINNRKILQGIIESVGEQDKFEEIVVAIDKLDKTGIDGVKKELIQNSISENSVEKLLELCNPTILRNSIPETMNLNDAEEALNDLGFITDNFEDNINTQKGIEELEFVFEKLKTLGRKTANIKFDPTLARGLGYYTGTIIEVKVDNFPSICGGGRYDDLTSEFGLKDVSGVGISFGADRIYDVLLDNDLYPEFKGDTTEVLFYNYGEGEEDICLNYLFQLRESGINAEFYPDTVKQKRQYNFAVKKGIRYVITVRSEEIKKGVLFLRDMESDTQYIDKTIEEVIEIIKTN